MSVARKGRQEKKRGKPQMRKVIASVIAVVGMTVLAGSASASLINSKVHANNLRLCNNRCVDNVVDVGGVLP